MALQPGLELAPPDVEARLGRVVGGGVAISTRGNQRVVGAPAAGKAYDSAARFGADALLLAKFLNNHSFSPRAGKS